ncbi:MAG: hypothetical protein HY363_03905 [Candidatus Aenigmarchaeota archaeon]|nr:hypothetical protein [Candidatus Aenigmarchaeota archaeon]
MNRKSTALIISCLLLLASCALTGQSVLPVVEEGLPVQVYFCPVDDCNGVLVSQLSNADDIVCALYSLDVAELRSILKEKNARIVAETDNKNDFSGLDVVFDNRNALMHNKFCVLDSRTVITGSYNPTAKNIKANNLVVIPSEFLAQNYLAEFNELRQGKFGAGKPVRYPVIIYNNATIQTAFCPEDFCAEKVLNTLKKAKENMKFMTYSFTDDKIGDFLAQTGLRVEGIFDSSQNSEYSEYNKLKNKSIVLKGIHHKVFIIDNTTVITGSYNPTKNGNEKNDENLLIITDGAVAQKYTRQFSQMLALRSH